jgi:hypothetical protein
MVFKSATKIQWSLVLVPLGGQRVSNWHCTHCHNTERVSLQLSVVCGSDPVVLSALKYGCVPFENDRKKKKTFSGQIPFSGTHELTTDCVWNVMAHAQKPDFVFRRNGRVHLNRLGRQFSRLLAAEVCASAVVMLDTPRSEIVWRVLATHSIRQFPLHFPSRASPCAIRFQTQSTCRLLYVEHTNGAVPCIHYCGGNAMNLYILSLCVCV